VAYDAFLSYNQRADSLRASAVQRALQHLARPFYRWKALNIFRDATSLSANPALWPSIEKGLANSRYFIFFACPESVASTWCVKELQWWLEQGKAETLLIVLTGGELAFDERAGDFDWKVTTSLPKAIAGKFLTEPLYRDLRWANAAAELDVRNPRFRDAVLPLAATLHGKEPQEIDGEDLRQFQRTRLFWRSAAAALIVLTLISGAAAWIAVNQRNEASRQRDQAVLQRNLAVGRQLAAKAQFLQATRPDQLPQSMMLAAESLQRTKSLEADQVIRSGLAILPKRTLQRRFAGYESSQGLTANDDPVLAFMTERGEVRVIYTGAGKFEDVDQWEPDRRITSLAHAFTGNGSFVAAGAKDGTVFLWELKQHEPRSVAQCDGYVLAIAASKNNIAAACDSGSLLLVDIASGSTLNLGEQWHDAVGVAFSKDGSKLGAAFVDGGVGVWDVDARKSVFRSRGNDSGTRRYAWSIVTFDPSGELLLTAITTDTTLAVRKASSGEVVSQLLGHRDLVLSAEFSQNGRLVATACADGSARVFDASTGGLLNEFRHGGAVRSVRFMPIDDMPISWITIATASEDGTARVWRLKDGREIARATAPSPLGIVIPRHTQAFVTLAYDGAMNQWYIPDQAVELDVGFLGSALAVQWSSSDALFTIAGSNGQLQTRDPAYRPRRAVAQESSWQADAARASADGERFLIAGSERAQLRDAQGALVTDMPLPPGRMRAIGADARTVAILGDDAIRVVDVVGKTDIGRIELPDHPLVDQLAVSDADVAYAGLGGVTVCSIRATSGKQCMRVGTREARAIAFSPDGRYLVWASVEPQALELRTRTAIALAGGDVGWGHLIAFTRDSERFVLGTENGLLVWSLPDGQRQLDIATETKPIRTVFSHGGDLLAAGMEDGTALLWQTRGRSEPIVRLAALKPADRDLEPITALALSDDNQFLLTLDRGGLSRTWAVSPQRISSQVCNRVAEDLTTQEWASFGSDEQRRVVCSKATRKPRHLR